MAILTAEIAMVNLGTFAIEGLMDERGDFYAGVPQLAELNLVPRKRSLKQLESLLGMDLQSHSIKLKTSINPKAINAIPIALFSRLIFLLAVAGNEQAIAVGLVLSELSLVQLFCDSFGVKFEVEDRQKWLKARNEGKETRRTFTDAIKGYLDAQPELSGNYKKWIYSNCSNRINRAVFNGLDAKQLKETRDLHYALLRDGHETPELKMIDRIEYLAMRFIDGGQEPLEATASAIGLLMPSAIAPIVE